MLSRDDVDLVCLDAGNTLVGMRYDLLADLFASTGIAATPVALERAEARVRPVLSGHLAAGSSSEAPATAVLQVQFVLEALGLPSAEARERAPALSHRIRAELPSRRFWTRVLPGVPAALRALRASGLRLVVVSNSDGTANQLLADVGLASLVDLVVDSSVIGVEKPDAGIWQHALRPFAVPEGRALHVGDLYAIDVVGARAAGLHAVLLDPFDDWGETDCPKVPDVPALAAALLGTAPARRGEGQV